MTKDLLEKMIKRAEKNGWKGFDKFCKGHVFGKFENGRDYYIDSLSTEKWKLLLFDKGFVEAFFKCKEKMCYSYNQKGCLDCFNEATSAILNGKENEFFERWV